MKQKTNIMSMYTGVAYDLKLDLEMFIYVYWFSNMQFEVIDNCRG